MYLESPRFTPKQGVALWLLVVILLVGCFEIFVKPFIFKSQGHPPIIEAINNARQIGTLLMLYDQDFGQYPDQKLPDDPSIRLEYQQQNRDDSNYILGHLLRSGYAGSEELFFAKIPQKTKLPDDTTNPDSEILTRGECGFTYLTFQDRPMKSTDNSELPVLVAHLNSNNLADRQTFDRKALFLRIDSSVQRVEIDKNGQIPTEKNQTLFQTGPGTPWGDKKPKFHHPLYLE